MLCTLQKIKIVRHGEAETLVRPWPSRKNEAFHPIAARFALAMTKNALLSLQPKINCLFNSLLHPNTFFVACKGQHALKDASFIALVDDLSPDINHIRNLFDPIQYFT